MPIAQLDMPPVMIEQVEDRLLEAIVEGVLAPGQRLTQDSIAAMFGVSRQPVSHALQALKRRGLVVEHGKRGLAVAPLDGTRALQLYQVRAALDGMAAEFAAALVAGQRAARDAIDRALRALEKGRKRAAVASMRELVALDVEFHTAVYELSGNAAVGETVAAQWPHFMRSMRLVLEQSAARERVWQEHAAIIEAVLDGKPSVAGRLAREHTLRAGQETAARLEHAALKFG